MHGDDDWSVRPVVIGSFLFCVGCAHVSAFGSFFDEELTTVRIEIAWPCRAAAAGELLLSFDA